MGWIIKMGVTIWALGHIIGAAIMFLFFGLIGMLLAYIKFEDWRLARKRRKAVKL